MASKNDTPMDGDLYADGSSPDAKPKGQGQDQEEQYESFIIPKSALGGKEYEPGQEINLRIVSIKGDRVEVQCADDDEKTEGDQGMAGQDQGGSQGGASGGDQGGQGQMASMLE